MDEFIFPNVPITFEWRGRVYRGELSTVRGAGSYGNHWHLSIESYHYGALFWSGTTWRFESNTGYFEGMADFFADYITAYIG